MRKTTNSVFKILLIGCLLLIGGGVGVVSTCTWAWAGISSSLIPNPAAEFCIKVGGEVQMFSDEGGVSGICKLGDAYVDEWTLFRGVKLDEEQLAFKILLDPQELILEDRTGRIGMPNPAAVYCKQVGGDLITMKYVGNDELEMTFCSFDDRSIIEQWTLFRGFKHPANKQLLKVLKKY